jgi:hypothetical protein
MGVEMATEQAVRDMITCFCGLYRREMNNALVNAWSRTLRKYQDNQITEAGFLVMEEMTRMPTPADLIERIKAVTEKAIDYEVGHEMNATCSKCGKLKWCRKELPRHPNYECEDCYTGLSFQQRKQRYYDLIVKMGWVA